MPVELYSIRRLGLLHGYGRYINGRWAHVDRAPWFACLFTITAKTFSALESEVIFEGEKLYNASSEATKAVWHKQ